MRAPQGERNGDVMVCSRMGGWEYDGQPDKNRRRRERTTEAHSERAGKRTAREEQHRAIESEKKDQWDYGWIGQEPSSGFCNLAPSILHYNWF
jgi:hypothetical protein